MRRQSARFAVLCVICSMVLLVSPVMGSTALNLPNLDIRAGGPVHASVQQPDGGVVIGGSFDFINGQARSNIARFLPDGSLDPTWNPGADGEVRALAVDSSGSIYVAGTYRNIGGMDRRGLAKLSGAGAIDPAWFPFFDSWAEHHYFSAIEVGPDSRLYVSGWFDRIGGESLSLLARLELDGFGAADPHWAPNRIARDIVFDGEGHVFTDSGGFLSGSLAKISMTGNGHADPAWVPDISGGRSTRMVMGSDGYLYIAGELHGTAPHHWSSSLVRVATTGQGQVDPHWTNLEDCCVEAMAADAFGNLYLTAMLPDGGSGTSYLALARVSLADGELDHSWNPQIDPEHLSRISFLDPDDRGGLRVAGGFSQLGTEPYMGYAIVDAAASVTAGAEVHRYPIISAVVRQPGGGLVVAGAFAKANGLSRNGILRIAPGGELDEVWNPPAFPQGTVDLVSVDSTGDVYARGSFGSLAKGRSTPNIELVKVDGTGPGQVDQSWSAQMDGWLDALVIGPDDAIYIGGGFTHVNGAPRSSLAKLGSVDGAVDAVWRPATDGWVSALAIDDHGGLIVAGDFSMIGGGQRGGLARLSSTGSGALDAVWTPDAVSHVSRLAIDSQGRVYLGGSFTHVGSTQRNGLARVSGTTGALDAAWNPSPNGVVASILMGSEGGVFVGGFFSAIGGAERSFVAKLDDLSGTGLADLAWNAQSDGPVRALANAGNAAIAVGGLFNTIGGQPRGSLAALRQDADSIFSDGFE